MDNEVIIRSEKEEDLEAVLDVVNSFVKDSFVVNIDEDDHASIVKDME